MAVRVRIARLSWGMLLRRSFSTTPKSSDITFHEGVDRETRQKMVSQKGVTLWMTGLSGSGKSTIAVALEEKLLQMGYHTYRLDGDNIRFGLNRNLGFSPEDRAENIRRIGEVAKLFNDSAVFCITSFISPYSKDRDLVREAHKKDGLPFYEVYVQVPLSVAEERDPKGLYKKARAGQLKQMTGIDDPYEEPTRAELVLPTHELSTEQAVQKLMKLLQDGGFLTKPSSK
eukprot:RCo011997